MIILLSAKYILFGFFLFLVVPDLQAQKISLSLQKNFTGTNLQPGLNYFDSQRFSLDGGLKFHFNQTSLIPNGEKQYFALNPAQHFGLYHQSRVYLPSIMADNFDLFLFHNIQFNTMGYKVNVLADVGFDSLGRTLYYEHKEQVPRIFSIEQNLGLGIKLKATQKLNFTFALGTGFIYSYIQDYTYFDPYYNQTFKVYEGRTLDYLTYHFQLGMIYNLSPERKFKMKD
jgi:hypothetical protein